MWATPFNCPLPYFFRGPLCRVGLNNFSDPVHETLAGKWKKKKILFLILYFVNGNPMNIHGDLACKGGKAQQGYGFISMSQVRAQIQPKSDSWFTQLPREPQPHRCLLPFICLSYPKSSYIPIITTMIAGSSVWSQGITPTAQSQNSPKLETDC